MATDEQLKIATALGISIVGDAASIAAAKIRDAVAPAILERAPESSTVKQQEFAATLGLDVRSDSKRVASARIEHECRRRSVEAVHTLKLKPGMLVMLQTETEFQGRTVTIREAEVISSIHEGGFVYFKGGNGKHASASRLRLPTRKEKSSIRKGERFFSTSPL